MDRCVVKRKANPKLTANAFNKLFFCWLVPIFKYGKNHDIKSKDLYEVLPENLSEPITDKLENYWKIELADAEKTKRKPSFLKAFQKTFRWTFLRYAIHCFCLHIVCKVTQPLLVGLLIWHFDERSNSSTLEIYGYATGFVFITICDSMLFNHMMLGLRSLGINARIACSSLIYRKIMKLPYSAKQVTRGRIMTLLSNDVSKLEFCFLFIHTFWILPLQIVLITYLTWRNVGAASLAGVFVTVLQTIPVQSFCGRVITKLRRKIASRTDERLLLTGEIVRGIRVIKMYTWEKSFEQLIFLARRYEIDVLATAAYLKSVLWSVTAFAQRTPLFFTVMIYVLQGSRISAYTMFTLVQYFNVLHVMTGSYFLRSVNTLSEGIASIKRIQEFLLLEEQVTNVKKFKSMNENNTMVSIVSVNASPIEKSEISFLNDINLQIDRKKLYAVVGPVGAGKVVCSLLKLILDELRPTKGQVSVYGSMSYASQEPWIFRGTLKSNILFGEIYDKDKYNKVTKACALMEDFNRLPNRDETIVGENCTSLSGGQCARINLARAVYRNADIYLLDDPLSAVDSRVGKRLFKDCINGLLKDKTRILITHQMQYLREADEIILINNGRVEFKGNFSDLEKIDELFHSLNLNDTKEVETVDDNKSIISSTSSISANENENKEPEETEKLLNNENIINKPIDKEIIIKDSMKHRKSIYRKYFTFGGSCLPVVTFVAFVIAQLMCSSCDYFVAYWTRKQEIKYNKTVLNATETDIPEHIDPHTAIYIFGLLMIGIIIMSVMKMVLYSTVCKNSNQRIHDTMATNLVKATMPFFQTNDSGQILNRFSKDLGTVDERLQAMMVETIEYFFIVLGVVLQIIIIQRWSVILLFIMAFLFYKGRVIAIKTTRNMMRLEAQAKSPVFSHVNSSFAGILTIRALSAQSMVCKEFDAHQDNHTAAASTSQYALIAYNFWLDLITQSFTALLTFSFLLLKNEQTAGADVGLALTQSLMMMGILARGIKLTGDIETQMISVERLFQYTELEQEDLLDTGAGNKPQGIWPSKGKIQFDNVYLKYSKNEAPILKELKFTIEAGSKIGIVGRTGAGKSSLISALFRLADIDGCIYIDDIDTKKIELKYLRKQISILPQEPILFSVSLRKNLDPQGYYDDALLWTTLQEVELNKNFDTLDITLDQNNLSTGQRQLLCLARAILRRNKILILDEATANVDINTDALIQKTIRAKFKDCTVLTIAHRLNTIMDCDKILVMDNGKVVEFDNPSILLKKNDGYFSKMYVHNSSRVLDNLTNISRKKK